MTSQMKLISERMISNALASELAAKSALESVRQSTTIWR